MSRDYNRVILMGRLTKDPDMRRTPSGALVARIALATGREWKDKTTGEKKSETDFHIISMVTMLIHCGHCVKNWILDIARCGVV